jgi:hypothetical protein
MARKPQTGGTIVLRSRGDALFVLCFSAFLTLPWLLLAGCQNSASTAKAPARQADNRTTVAQEPQTAAAAKAPEGVETAKAGGPGPRIVVEKAIYDFGEVGPDVKRTAQFKFTNSGKAPLKIAQVRTCCGVVARGVENGQEYAPGQSGTLELDYNTSLYPGTVSKQIYLMTNDPEHNPVTLTIKATVVRRVEYKPERLKLFLRQENAGCPDITLKSLDGRPFSVTGFKSTANALKAQFDPEVKATEFVLKLQADMEKIPRNLKGQVSIDLTHPECKNVRLLYDVLPEFTISPPQITMFNLKADQGLRRAIWILSNYQDDFEIESVSSQKGTIKLVEQKKVGNRYQLQVEVTPPAPADERAVLSDTLEVKIKGGETLSIAFRGFY